MKRLNLALVCLFLTQFHCNAYANGDGAPPPPIMQELGKDWVYGFVEYEHDLDKANLYYMKLQAHPDAKIPKITGGYATTDVDVFVKLRGVDVSKSLHQSRHRKRPHVFQRQERKRWAETMARLWGLIEQSHTFRVHNMKHIGTEVDGDTYPDGVIEADIELLMGGKWENLALLLVNEEFARPLQKDGTLWDPGSREYSILNPNIPK